MTADNVFDPATDADVAEQRRSVREDVPDQESSVTGPSAPPDETSAADWQEQGEVVDAEPDFDEFRRPD